MEAEYHKLKAFPSFKYTAAAISREGSETDEIPRFQKLRAVPSFKHVIEAAAPTTTAISREGSETDEIPRCQKLRAVPSFKHVIDAAATAAAISREGSETDGELPRYTSLKDVMTNLSPRSGGGGADIAIRNELVKHAASAYVLSATIINPAHRDGQDSRIYERIKMCCLGFLSCWQIHVGLPLEALCWPLVDFVYQIVRRVRNGLRGVVEIT